MKILALARILHEQVGVGVGWRLWGKGMGVPRPWPVLVQTTPFPPSRIQVVKGSGGHEGLAAQAVKDAKE